MATLLQRFSQIVDALVGHGGNAQPVSNKSMNDRIYFNDLVVGKVYDTVEKRGPRPLYIDPFDDCRGTLNENDTFVVLELKRVQVSNWTKLLTPSGFVGWVAWDASREFIKVSK